MSDDGEGVFSARLAWLFEHRRKPDGTAWSGAEVSQDLKRQFNADLSPTLINSLRRGASGNPTRTTIELLAAFFGVPAAFFFDDIDGDRAWTRELLMTDLPTVAPAMGATVPTRPASPARTGSGSRP